MIVYKFGGTVLLEEDKIVKMINDGLKEHKKIVVVVSALGRMHSPYSTDTLYSLCEYASSKEIARLVSCGEIISSVMVSNMLKKNNVNATSLSVYEMNLVYDNGFMMNDYLSLCLNQFDVVIVPGFLGLKGNEIILLPRGGSNITASFLASYFKSELVIFTDVDGIYLSDPKEDINAKKMEYLTYNDLKEITKNNHKLFPLEGIKYLEEANVKVLIRNLDNFSGTLIN